jgi:hypothetical protein
MTSRDDIKRDVFYRLLDLSGRVYVVVQHSDGVVIGRRGFTEEERQHGLVLVFNRNMRFTWDTDGIHATLVFGGVAEKCYIPVRDILAIYSPDAKVQLTIDPSYVEEKAPDELTDVSGEQHDHHRSVHVERDGKVIKVDFHRHDNVQYPGTDEEGAADDTPDDDEPA